MKKIVLVFLLTITAAAAAPYASGQALYGTCNCICSPQSAFITESTTGPNGIPISVVKPNVCTPPEEKIVIGRVSGENGGRDSCGEKCRAQCSNFESCAMVCAKNDDCPSGQVCTANGLCDYPTTNSSGSSSSATPFKPIAPALSINIPLLNLSEFSKFSTGTDKDGNEYVALPYITVYLSTIFRLSIGAAAVLAVIMIMIGGFVWAASAGDAGRIKTAKNMITSAATGLFLTLGAYTFLQVVNPGILNMQGLKVALVQPRYVDIVEDYVPETETPITTTGAPSQYDEIFSKYAPCAGVTADTLKAIAKAESGLQADRVNNSGYIGLFQTKAANCPASVTKYCGDLKDPDNNTAVASAMIRKSADYIAAHCPGSSSHDQMLMLYIAHNMGFGMLKFVTKQGCDAKTMREKTIDFYEDRTDTARAYAPKYQAGCLNGRTDVRAYAECTGGPKFDYASRLAASAPSTVIASSDAVCPY